MTTRAIVWTAMAVGTAIVAGGCQGGGDTIDADVSAKVAYMRGVSWQQGELADYGIDALGRVETGASLRTRALPLEPPRPTPYQQFRVLMDGRERWSFYGRHWDGASVDVAPGDRFLLDRRERFLRHRGTRVKWALLDGGLTPGLSHAEAEQIVNTTLGSEPVWRDSSKADDPGLTSGGALDYSLDVIERVAWRTFNGFGQTHTWLHFRNGNLERWEVHAESN
jgi:hypothetical protein